MWLVNSDIHQRRPAAPACLPACPSVRLSAGAVYGVGDGCSGGAIRVAAGSDGGCPERLSTGADRVFVGPPGVFEEGEGRDGDSWWVPGLAG